MKASQLAYSIIRTYEGLRLTAYLCPNDKWTIGYGHTRNVKPGDVITKAKAEELLIEDVAEVEVLVNKLALKVNQNQFDAIVSFVFNLGIGNFGGATLLKKIRKNPNDATIANEFLQWNKGDGSHDKVDNDGDGLVDEPGEKRVLPGLKTRREREAELYFMD
jgi:lysozyme